MQLGDSHSASRYDDDDDDDDDDDGDDGDDDDDDDEVMPQGDLHSASTST
jgi:hypothetical protein